MMTSHSIARPVTSVHRSTFQTTRKPSLVCRAQQQPQQPRLPQQIAVTTAAAVLAAGLTVSNAAWAREGVSFKTPANNVTIMSPLHLEFAVEGMDVLPAADGLIEGTGHFHLMIDEKTQFEEGRSIPFDETHLHYGKGQTAADITLTPFANALHQSYGSKYAATITVKAQ